MASLRQTARPGQQLLGAALSSWRPCTFQLRHNSTNPTVATDIEAESSLLTSGVSREGLSFTDPRKRASRRKHELPSGRYRYHPPKYYRGPMHPVQPPPSSDPVSRDFVPGPFNYPRLKQTYHSTFASDLMTLTYQHVPPGTPKRDERIRLREWGDESPYMINRPRRGPRGSEVLYPLERPLTFRNIPQITAVHVNSFIPGIDKSYDQLMTAKSILRTITGVRSQAVYAKESVSQWKLIKGHKCGLKASIYGDQAYELVDKIVNLVLPKIKEWPGIKSTTGDSTGNVLFGLTQADVMHFPEVEANYSLYPPRMIPGMHIIIETTAKSDRHARLFASSIGFPFQGKHLG